MLDAEKALFVYEADYYRVNGTEKQRSIVVCDRRGTVELLYFMRVHRRHCWFTREAITVNGNSYIIKEDTDRQSSIVACVGKRTRC